MSSVVFPSLRFESGVSIPGACAAAANVAANAVAGAVALAF